MAETAFTPSPAWPDYVPPPLILSQEGDGSPVGIKAPDFERQLYYDSTNDTYWRSTGLTNADWTEISGGGGSNDYSYTTNNGTTYAGLLSKLGIVAYFGTSLEGITSITFDKLTSMTEGVDIESAPDLQSLNFPVLTTLSKGLINIAPNPALTSVTFPVLASSSVDITIATSPLMTTFSLPSLTVFTGDLFLSGLALNTASVNGLLATLVAIPTWGNAGESVNLSGGTSAAPSGQGILDAATLSGRGASVTTN